MHKLPRIFRLLPWCAALPAVLVAAGCETSNQDYSGSAQVVNVTGNPAYGADSQAVMNPSQQAGLRGTAAVSSGYNGTAARYQQAGTGAAAAQGYQDSAMIPVQAAVGSQAVSAVNSGTVPAPAATYSSDGTMPNYTVSTAALPPDTPVAAAASPAAYPAAVSTAGAGVVKPYQPDGSTASSAPLKATGTVSGDTYTVVRGDTLYSIAFRYGLDFRALAASNGIEPPYNIAVGQVIRLNQQASRAPTYTVKRGDTLYSIAKSNGQSVSFLAGVNNLTAPYNLSAGQVLYLARTDATTNANRAVQTDVPVAGQIKSLGGGSGATTAATAATAAASGKQAAGSASTTTVLTKPVVVPGATRKVGGVTWTWPAKGSVIEGFSTAEQGNKGIDIAGNRGQQVLAAADGQVVYAGNALRGYGNLIIINHANEYLSAYAHNEVLQVKEGQSVKRGQQIARMGSTDAKSVRLHFEIRYRGQSVNPIGYLPK